MTTDKVDIYRGLVLSRILARSKIHSNSLRQHPDIGAAIILNKTVGLYVKYSTKRMSPWVFSFQEQHRSEIELLKNQTNNTFAILVCGMDGIVCLSWAEYCISTGTEPNGVAWIKASRGRREQYLVTGSGGGRGLKISDNSFPSRAL